MDLYPALLYGKYNLFKRKQNLYSYDLDNIIFAS